MVDLPAPRLCPFKPPFFFAGMDAFGPFVVKRARSEVKRYGCIFVCFNSRAMELLSDLSASSFIQALRRFVSRRGTVAQLWCDKGTNFIGAKNELAKLPCFHQETLKWAADQRIEFVLIPSAASHMGGVWERLLSHCIH
jgi:hypothetical protein